MEKIQCNLCDKQYSSIYSLSNHKRIYHDKIKNDIYNCRKCDKIYKNHRSRWVHEKKCSPKSENIEIEK